ncbi:MAG: cellulase family glycosylhydrolase, partial [Verrucomicrobiota bacterium]
MRYTLTMIAALLVLPLAALRAADDDLSWMRGTNYVPSYAKNDIQLWLEYDPAVIDRELGYAQRLKLNTVRTFLNVAVFEKQPEKFMADFENFLSLADKHGLKAMPVLFDSCEDPQEVDVNNYKKTMNWIPSPGFSRLGDQDWPAMEKFIVALVGKYRDDKRIVLWDVMNEPESTRKWDKPEDRARIVEFVRRALKRVKAENPAAPIGIGWQRSGEIPLTADLSDVLVIHNYPDVNGLQANIRRIQEMGKTMNKPVILNEFVGRPQQRIEKALPIAAREKTGWCFWELMIGSTRFSQGRVPYQGHIYPDGTCFSATEVATILNPEGFTGDATEIARKAGFEVSEKAPKPFTDESITFSASWEKFAGIGPASDRLWYASTKGETAQKEVSGTSVEVVFKHGPDCGIAGVTVDGKPVADVDTYAKEIDWNKKTVVAKDLSPGKHTVVVTTTGRKSAASSNSLVQLVNLNGSEVDKKMWTPPMYFGDATRLGRPFAKDPSVIRFGGRYLMYYSVAAWEKELAPPDAPRGWAIGIAESRDLVNWKKIG